MGKTLDFEYYWKDELCSKVHVDYSKQTIDVQNFINDPVKQAFGRQKISMDIIDDFCRDRVGVEDLLSYLGLRCFDAEAIARKTHGMLTCDFGWISFSDSPITYEEIAKLRGWV